MGCVSGEIGVVLLADWEYELLRLCGGETCSGGCRAECGGEYGGGGAEWSADVTSERLFKRHGKIGKQKIRYLRFVIMG